VQKSRIVNYAIINNRQAHSPAAARLSPIGGTTFQTTSPLSFGESFMKIRSAVPENGCLIAKHQNIIKIRHSPGGGTTFAKWRTTFQTTFPPYRLVKVS